jgi:saccharopine dehydrogenase (NAD+, L-lysine-forming)
MGNPIKAAIIGCGGVGQVIGQQLAKSDLISELILADVDLKGAETVKQRTGSDKISIEKVDASKVGAVAKVAKKADVVINGTVPMLNLKIMEGCLKGGASYIDMASGDKEFGHPMLEDQFPQDKTWTDAGLLALVSMGIDPGASNLFAKRAADRMESVEYVRVRDADTGSLEGYEFATYFSPQAMMEEVLRDPMYWEDGKFKRSPALEVSETYEFPDPIGSQKVFRTDHEESELVPQFLGKPVKFVDFMITLDDKFVETVRFLKRLGLTETKPLNVKGHKIRPFDVVVAAMPRPDALSGKIKGRACVLTEVKGVMKGKPTIIRTWTHISHERAHELCGIHATSYQTGCPVAVAVEMIARGEITATGVKPPEVIDPVKFCEYLPEKEIPVFEEIKEL